MLRDSRRNRALLKRIKRAMRSIFQPDLYGLEWGDPDNVPPLRFVRDTYLRPYVNPDHIALEIGPGGGRWTRYLLNFKTVYVVDYHAELLAELRRTFRHPNIVPVRNNGTDFPGIPAQSVDFLFSFGVFVHFDAPIIESYLCNMKQLLRPHANVVIHYSDKTKRMAQQNRGFSDNDPERMRRMVRHAGYTILEEDLTTMWHSSIIRFTP
jgi:SAM-dependent methyltransferase